MKIKTEGNKKLLMNKVKGTGSNIRLNSPTYTSQKILELQSIFSTPQFKTTKTTRKSKDIIN